MQSIRFACDRCRGQKLRCSREDGFYQPCKRCKKAGVACHGRDTPLMSHNRRISIPSPFRYNTQEPETRGITPTTLQLSNEERFPMFAEDSFLRGEGGLLYPTDTQFGNVHNIDLPVTSLEYWSHWDPENTSPSSGDQSFSFLSPEGSSPLISKSRGPQHLPPVASPILDYTPNPNAGLGNSDQSNSKENRSSGILKRNLQLEGLETAAASNASPSPGHTGAQSYVSDEIGVEQLLELTRSLYIQQKSLETAPWMQYLSRLSLTGPKSSSKVPPAEVGAAEPIGDILKSSEIFLDIITHFLATIQNNTQQPSPRLGASSHPSSGSAKLTLDSLDTAMILLILTCYIRLLFIYTMLFSHINKYLSFSPSTKSPIQVLNESGTKSNPESLHIGGFSLGSYGEIQIKILVDISTHFIRSIESTLGLPQKYRLMAADAGADDDMDLDASSSNEGTLSMRPQMKILLETVIGMVELDNHEGDDERKWGIGVLRKEFEELQKLHRWKL